MSRVDARLSPTPPSPPVGPSVPCWEWNPRRSSLHSSLRESTARSFDRPLTPIFAHAPLPSARRPFERHTSTQATILGSLLLYSPNCTRGYAARRMRGSLRRARSCRARSLIGAISVPCGRGPFLGRSSEACGVLCAAEALRDRSEGTMSCL